MDLDLWDPQGATTEATNSTHHRGAGLGVATEERPRRLDPRNGRTTIFQSDWRAPFLPHDVPQQPFKLMKVV